MKTRLFNAAILVAWLAFCCVWFIQLTSDPLRTHNREGGYIDACDDLPGMLGDDC